MPPAYDYVCVQCNHMSMEIVSYEERDTFIFSCRRCGGVNLVRQFPSPTPLKASYADGQKRAGWAEAREIAKLKVHEAQIKGLDKSVKTRDDVKRIKKQISDLSGSLQKTTESKGREDIVYDKPKGG